MSMVIGKNPTEKKERPMQRQGQAGARRHRGRRCGCVVLSSPTESRKAARLHGLIQGREYGYVLVGKDRNFLLAASLLPVKQKIGAK